MDSDALAALLAVPFATLSALGVATLFGVAFLETLPPSLTFWWHFGQTFSERLCHQGTDSSHGKYLRPPNDQELQQIVDSAPPMIGWEYLDSRILINLWSRMRGLAIRQARMLEGGADTYLYSVNPLLHFLGHLTFHLAENKKDSAHPFLSPIANQ